MIPDADRPSDPFALPLKSVDDAQAVVRAVKVLLGQQKVSFRSPSPLPDGCSGCVWQGYYEALAYWRDQAKALLR